MAAELFAALIGQLAQNPQILGDTLEKINKPMPNVPFPVLDIDWFWVTEAKSKSYKLQRNKIAGNYRVLKGCIRVAWGGQSVMKDRSFSLVREAKEKAYRPPGVKPTW